LLERRDTQAGTLCYPMHAEYMSKELAKVAKVLEDTGLTFDLGPMGTCAEGDLEQVLAAIKRCRQAVAGGHERVITIIALDDFKKQSHHLSDMITNAENQIGHRVTSKHELFKFWPKAHLAD
jgi:uncharacterized protein YqgV (UPF0045/DUF77 family)